MLYSLNVRQREIYRSPKIQTFRNVQKLENKMS